MGLNLPAVRALPAAPGAPDVIDVIEVVVEMARLAAHRGRERWRADGGRLRDQLDHAMDEFEAELRAHR